jgi:Flp pilus assembly protein TadG
MKTRQRLQSDRSITLKYRVPLRGGAVIPLVAISLVVILACAALSVDAGNLYRERRNTQIAADAAAEAAAMELYASNGNDTDAAETAALTLAQAHGYDAEAVTVNMPPAAGAFAGKHGYVEVIVNANPPRFFSGISSNSALVVTSRAVAAGTYIPTKASVLILEPKKNNALKFKGSSSILEVGGDIIVNSKAKKAVNIKKKSQVKAEHVLVTGGLSKNSRRSITGEVKTGVMPTPDPFEYLPPPPKSTSMDASHFRTTVAGKDVYNLVPGTYKSLKFDKNDEVRMSPGTYYVNGGGFEIKGDATVQASGVMIYNEGKRGFKISTKGNVQISPPTSGTYQGISLFQESLKKTKVEFAKQSQINISGILYAPNSEVKFKKSDMTIDDGDDEDWEEESDEPMEEDVGPVETTGIGAAIVAKKLSVGSKTKLIITGSNIPAKRPILTVVE